MSFEFISPGVVVDQTNFETCAHRTEATFLARRCCGSPPAKIEGHRCNLFNINGITATTCLNCKSYQNGKERKD